MTWQEIPGWFDFAELYDEQVKAAADGAVFVEVGCWLGRSTAYLAQAIAASGKDIALHAVDNFQGVTVGQGERPDPRHHGKPIEQAFRDNLTACGLSDRVRVIVSDSAEAAGRFADGSVDFVFIDADHSYEAVKRDIAAWRPKVKPGGVIAGHDRVRVGVGRAVVEAFGRYETSGPLAWFVRV